MANHASAKKRIRQTERRTAVNIARKSRIRTYLKNVETAITAGDKDTAVSAMKIAQPEMHRGVLKGLMHRNTVARQLSRLTRRIAAI